MGSRFGALAIAVALPAAGCVSASDARLGQFERLLATHDSATAALTEWCETRGIANPAMIRAVRVEKSDYALPAGIGEMMDIAAGDRLQVRHVRLLCGQLVLSEAINVYVASRLSEPMNRTLESTDTPFGRVIAPLGFTRERLASFHGQAADCPAGTVLTQRALLRLSDGRPISALLECYTAAILAPPPRS